MFKNIWQWAGQYRKTGKTIGILPYQIPMAMKTLEKDIVFWEKQKTFDPIEFVARVHHRLVWIHPYENGNGQHARLIADMIFRSMGYDVINWPTLADQDDERLLYLTALREADQHDFSSLIHYLERYSSINA